IFLSPTEPSGAVVHADLGPMVSVPRGWWTSSTLVLAVWAVWAAANIGRIGAAAWALGRAKKLGTSVEPEREHRLRHWTQVRSAGRAARLVVSDHVRSAAVLGFGR